MATMAKLKWTRTLHTWEYGGFTSGFFISENLSLEGDKMALSLESDEVDSSPRQDRKQLS